MAQNKQRFVDKWRDWLGGRGRYLPSCAPPFEAASVQRYAHALLWAREAVRRRTCMSPPSLTTPRLPFAACMCMHFPPPLSYQPQPSLPCLRPLPSGLEV
eukprot:58126-Chlamydomonas_euryale.AAC.1